MTVNEASNLTIRAALKYAAANCPDCLLCGAESTWAGAWVPPGRLDWLFGQEKVGFCYALCDDCKQADNAGERVAAELIARHGPTSQN